MRRLSATTWFVVLLCAALVGLLVFGLSANQQDKSIDAAIAAGERPAAPGADRLLPVLGGSERRSLASFRGRVVVLNFWASWCPPCREEAPVLRRAQETLSAERSGTVLGVTFDDAASASMAFERTYRIRYPSLRDVGTALAEEFGTRSLPETFVIDPRGRIVSVSRGAVGAAFLRDAIAKAKRSA